MMKTRLRRFYEALPYGERTARLAYVISIAAMPDAANGAEWREDPTFNVADAILGDPGLKRVLTAAIDAGCVVVEVPQ